MVCCKIRQEIEPDRTTTQDLQHKTQGQGINCKIPPKNTISAKDIMCE